jgi:hypothetical protein
LVANIQKLTQTHPALKTFVVFQGGPELKEPLTKLAAEKKITIPMTFLPQGTSDPDFGNWKINPEAKNTIVMYSRRRVHGNFVDVTEKSWEEVAKAAAEMLGK